MLCNNQQWKITIILLFFNKLMDCDTPQKIGNLVFWENFLKLSSNSIKWDSIVWQISQKKMGVSWQSQKKSWVLGTDFYWLFLWIPDGNSWVYFLASSLIICEPLFVRLPNITMCHSPIGNWHLPPSPALFDISHLLALPCHCNHVLDSVINRHMGMGLT
jgi:hypothetical protein